MSPFCFHFHFTENKIYYIQLAGWRIFVFPFVVNKHLKFVCITLENLPSRVSLLLTTVAALGRKLLIFKVLSFRWQVQWNPIPFGLPQTVAASLLPSDTPTYLSCHIWGLLSVKIKIGSFRGEKPVAVYSSVPHLNSIVMNMNCFHIYNCSIEYQFLRCGFTCWLMDLKFVV